MRNFNEEFKFFNLASLVFVTGCGALILTENAAATTVAQYVGAVLYFNNLVDASAFSGVEFTLSGAVSGCSLQFSVYYAAADAAATDPKGTCTLSVCYPPQRTITTTTTPTMMRFAWADMGTAGSPWRPVFVQNS